VLAGFVSAQLENFRRREIMWSHSTLLGLSEQPPVRKVGLPASGLSPRNTTSAGGMLGAKYGAMA
jgi:hypothetical protein